VAVISNAAKREETMQGRAGAAPGKRRGTGPKQSQAKREVKKEGAEINGQSEKRQRCQGDGGESGGGRETRKHKLAARRQPKVPGQKRKAMIEKCGRTSLEGPNWTGGAQAKMKIRPSDRCGRKIERGMTGVLAEEKGTESRGRDIAPAIHRDAGVRQGEAYGQRGMDRRPPGEETEILRGCRKRKTRRGERCDGKTARAKERGAPEEKRAPKEVEA